MAKEKDEKEREEKVSEDKEGERRLALRGKNRPLRKRDRSSFFLSWSS